MVSAAVYPMSFEVPMLPRLPAEVRVGNVLIACTPSQLTPAFARSTELLLEVLPQVIRNPIAPFEPWRDLEA